jgi:hypothetical protein
MTLNLTEQEKQYLRSDYARWLASQEAAKTKVSAPTSGYTSKPTTSSSLLNTLKTIGGGWIPTVTTPVVNTLKNAEQSYRSSSIGQLENKVRQPVMSGIGTGVSKGIEGTRFLSRKFGEQAYKITDPEQSKNYKLTLQMGEEYDSLLRQQGINEKDPNTKSQRQSIASSLVTKYKGLGWQPSEDIEKTSSERYAKESPLTQAIYELPADLLLAAIATPIGSAIKSSEVLPKAVKAVGGAVTDIYGFSGTPEGQRGSFKFGGNSAEDLIKSVDAGNTPAFVSAQMEGILRANNISEEAIRSKTPGELIEMLRSKVGTGVDATRQSLRDRGFTDAYIDMMPASEKAKILQEPIPTKEVLEAPAQPLKEAAGQVTPPKVVEAPQVAKEVIPTSAGEVPPIEPPKSNVSSSNPESLSRQQKLLDLIEEHKTARTLTDEAYKEARAPKFQNIAEIRKQGGGESSMSKVGASLKGELPKEQVVFKNSLAKEEIDAFHNDILSSSLSDAEVYSTQKAFTRITDPDKYKLLFPEDVTKVNTPLRSFEIKAFEKVWGKEFVDKLAKDQSWLRKAMKANDIFYDVYYNSLLGGKAIVRNTIGNLMRIVTEPLESGLSGLVDIPLSKISRRGQERFVGEAWHEAAGGFAGIADGARESVNILKTGNRFNAGKYELPEEGLKSLFTETKGVKGKVARGATRVATIPSTLMEVGDAAFFSPAKQQALNRLAYRQARMEKLTGDALTKRVAELVANPSVGMMSDAKTQALDLLFRGKSAVSDTVSKLRDTRIAGFQPFRVLVPFVKVPWEVGKYGLSRSPLAVFNYKMWVNIARKDPQAADQIARLLIGSGIATAFATYAYNGNLTGAAPANASERDRFFREGKTPYALKIGNRWISYQQIPALSQTLAMVASATDAIKSKNKSSGDKVTEAVYGIAQNTIDQTYLQSVSDALDALNDPERSAEAFVKRTVPGFVPYNSTTRLVTQATDPYVRQAGNVGEGIKTNLPGLSGQVPIKQTALGEDITRTTPWWSPWNTSVQQDNLLNEELKKNAVNIGFVSPNVGTISLDKTQQNEYQHAVGQVIKSEIIKLIQTPEYQALSGYEAKQKLSSTISKARDLGKAQYIMKSGITNPQPGDTKATTQSRKDLKRVSEYLTLIDGVTNDTARSKISSILRATDPSLDVAMILNGYATQPKTDVAESYLSKRRNGSTDDYPSSLNTGFANQVVSLVSSYYGVEDRVWGMYPPQVKAMADNISELENGNDYDKRQAKLLLRRNPSIVKARQLIANYKRRMRSNRTLDNLLTNYA